MNPIQNITTAAIDNLVTHVSWIQERTPGMRVSAAPDLTLSDCGLPCDTFNIVCRAQLDNAAPRIREAIDYFEQRPFAWWLNPGDQPDDLGAMLQDAGLQAAESELAMAADLASLRMRDLAPAGLQIRRVQNAAQLRDFAAIVAANWSPPDEQVIRFYEMAAPSVLHPDSPLWLYVGYMDEIPVTTSELTVGGGVVGLYNICTLMDYRRKGFGTAMTLQPLLDARSQGYQHAILQASDGGKGIYAQLGFETFGQITEYKPNVL